MRLHKVDQDSAQAPQLELTVNSHRFEGALPTGLRIQYSVPTHRVLLAATEFDLPGGALQEGSIGLEAHPETTTGLPGTRKRRNCCCGRQPIAFLTTGVGRDR